MITTREFFETDADNIILDLETIWTVQRDKNGKKYINIPFPDKEEVLESYLNGLDDPFDELSDYDELSEQEEQQMIDEQVQRISNVYDRVLKSRTEFEKSLNNN